MALTTTIASATADSYGTLADWETYATAKGWTTAGTDAVKETYLRRAADYLDRQFIWKGTRTVTTQALMWPRYISDLVNDFAVPSDEIPQAIINAQFEIAWEIHNGIDVFASIDSGAAKRSKVKVDVIEEETEYASPQSQPFYPAVRGLIADYIVGTKATPAFGSVPLLRA